MWKELAFAFKHANPYLVGMSVLFFFGLVILIERIIMLHFVYNINLKKFLSDFKKTVLANDHERAMTICKSASHTSVPMIALKALKASENDPTTVKGTIEEETIDFLPYIENRIDYLPMLSTLMLLTGILATIDNLWMTFNSINILDTARKQASLASNISTALGPTALGLIISMFLLVSHQFIKNSALRLTHKIQYGITVIYNLLVPVEVPTVYAASSAGNYNQSDMPVQMEGEENTKTANSKDGGIDDTFDDATVEDIKDEEEII